MVGTRGYHGASTAAVNASTFRAAIRTQWNHPCMEATQGTLLLLVWQERAQQRESGESGLVYGLKVFEEDNVQR